MMQRATQRPPTLLENLRRSLLRWLGRSGEGGGTGNPPDNSPELVALGALERVLPGGIKEDDMKALVGKIQPAELYAQAIHALDMHAARFDMGRLQESLPRFRQLARGVRMEPPAGGPKA
ncbi:hypothetical protein D9M69_654590 [compost metagenome]